MSIPKTYKELKKEDYIFSQQKILKINEILNNKLICDRITVVGLDTNDKVYVYEANTSHTITEVKLVEKCYEVIDIDMYRKKIFYMDENDQSTELDLKNDSLLTKINTEIKNNYEPNIVIVKGIYCNPDNLKLSEEIVNIRIK